MLICVLSADYLSNSNAVFVLESGVQVGLHFIESRKLTLYSCHIRVIVFMSFQLSESSDMSDFTLHNIEVPEKQTNMDASHWQETIVKLNPNLMDIVLCFQCAVLQSSHGQLCNHTTVSRTSMLPSH